MIITVLITRGVSSVLTEGWPGCSTPGGTTCRQEGVGELEVGGMWSNHAPASIWRWDPQLRPPGVKGPGVHRVLSGDQSPVLDIMGIPVPSNPTPQSHRPQTGRCRIKCFHLASSAASEIYRCYTSLRDSSSQPLHISRLSGILPTPHFPETPSRPTTLWMKRRALPKRCSDAPHSELTLQRTQLLTPSGTCQQESKPSQRLHFQFYIVCI